MGFSISEPELWRPRGFCTSILMEGNQRASLSRNLNYGDQGTSLPRSWWKVTKGLLYPGTWIVATKGLLYLDLDGRCPRASLPRNLNYGNQGPSLPRSWWKVSKGLLDLKLRNLELFLKICSWRFVLWRFVRRDLSFEDLFMEICPLKISCKKNKGSFSLICITHELPLFDLCIWWLWYVWTYPCKSLIQKSLEFTWWSFVVQSLNLLNRFWHGWSYLNEA